MRLAGTDDDARRRWVKTAPVVTLREILIRHEYQGDSSTMRYLRGQPVDRRVQQLIKERGKDWTPRVLSCPYHELAL